MSLFAPSVQMEFFKGRIELRYHKQYKRDENKDSFSIIRFFFTREKVL